MSFSTRNLVTDLVITTALTGVVSGEAGALYAMNGLDVEVDFVYGSAGTSVAVYIQTTLDNTNWFDIMAFAFTTASARKAMAVVMEAVATPPTLTDGTMTGDTSQTGLLGDRIRVKVTSVGTYAGDTTLNVRMAPKGGGS